MEIQLAPTWILTTDHAASSYGKPVLVNQSTNETFGPEDLVRAYPSWGLSAGREVVRRLAEMVTLTSEERANVARFINQDVR